jgi:hypothetical protein
MGASASIPETVDAAAAAALMGSASLAFDAAKFTELAGESGTLTTAEVNAYLNSALPNSAFVFIKPHANTAAAQAYVKGALEAAGCSVLAEGPIAGTDIDSKKLIDQHYYAIASKATILKPKDLAVPADKFEEKFGEGWEAVLAEDRAVNAMDACERFGLDAQQLEVEWRKCEPGE